jgi:hypothetical protein
MTDELKCCGTCGGRGFVRATSGDRVADKCPDCATPSAADRVLARETTSAKMREVAKRIRDRETADVQEAPDVKAARERVKRIMYPSSQAVGQANAALDAYAAAIRADERKSGTLWAETIIANARERERVLREALLEYGGHLGYCMSANVHGGERECICGFSALLTTTDAPVLWAGEILDAPRDEADCPLCGHAYHDDERCVATVSHDAGVPGACGCDAPRDEVNKCHECNTDLHRCRGCGTSVPHGGNVCGTCVNLYSL